MARTEKAMQDGVATSKGNLDFKGRSMMYVTDDVADEIDQTQGLKGDGDVWVHEDPILNWTTRYKADGVHSYIFGSSPSYSDAWEAFEKRREDRRRRERGDTPEVTQ